MAEKYSKPPASITKPNNNIWCNNKLNGSNAKR